MRLCCAAALTPSPRRRCIAMINRFLLSIERRWVGLRRGVKCQTIRHVDDGRVVRHPAPLSGPPHPTASHGGCRPSDIGWVRGDGVTIGHTDDGRDVRRAAPLPGPIHGLVYEPTSMEAFLVEARGGGMSKTPALRVRIGRKAG